MRPDKQKGSSSIPPPYSIDESDRLRDERARLYPQNCTQNYGSQSTLSVAPPKRSQNNRTSIAVIILVFILGYLIHTPIEDYLNRRERSRWDREVIEHEMEQNQWTRWVAEMKLERQTWDKDRARRQAQDRIDSEERHKAMKADEEAWEEARRRRADRDQADAEERERLAQAEREAHERRRSEIAWQDFNKGKCLRYKTREYTATLSNVPLGFNAMEECTNKTLRFVNRDLVPDWCEDPGTCGKVIGHWNVDFYEPACAPFFSKVYDKGCTGGRRRYDAKLENIQEWDSWKEVCSSMSTSYRSITLPEGASCSECKGGKCGYWATWEIEDYRCH